MSVPRAIVSWSSGKDSAWALEVCRRNNNINIVGLLTTVTNGYDRVSMHGVREEILDRQAELAGLPCVKVRIPPRASNADYQCALAKALGGLRDQGIRHVVFGDLFLQDVRRYREQMLMGSEITPLFPLWGRDTADLAGEMIGEGLRAVVVCLDPRRLARAFAGRSFDGDFLQQLPPQVDPCGENGEFHTCVTDGPMFAAPVSVERGEVVERDGFVFADLLCPAPAVLSAQGSGAR